MSRMIEPRRRAVVLVITLLLGAAFAAVAYAIDSMLASDMVATTPKVDQPPTQSPTTPSTPSTAGSTTDIVATTLELDQPVSSPFAPLRTAHDPGPLGIRTNPAVVVLTDGRVAIWGGEFEAANLGFPDLEDAYFNDGAVYDPFSQSWTMMTETDLPATSSGPPFGLVAGDRVFWFSDRHGASWNPDSNAWKSLAPAPGPVGRSVWDVDRVISLGAGAMYDPTKDEWRPLPASWATVLDSGAELIKLRGRLVAATGKGDAVTLHRLTNDDRWEIVSSAELNGSVSGFTVASHEDVAYLVSATGTTIQYNFDTGVWSPPKRLPLPSIPRYFKVVATSLGPVWFGGGTAIRLNDPSLLPVPDQAGLHSLAGGRTEVWGFGLAGKTQTLVNFDVTRLPSQQIVGFDAFALEVSDLEFGIEQEPLSTVLTNQSAIKFNLRFATGSCELTVVERLSLEPTLGPTLRLEATLRCSDGQLVSDVQSRII